VVVMVQGCGSMASSCLCYRGDESSLVSPPADCLLPVVMVSSGGGSEQQHKNGKH